MKLGTFLKYRIARIAAFVICAAIFVVCLYLEGVALRFMLYPLLLSAVLGLATLLAEYLKALRKCEQLSKICTYDHELMPELPQASEDWELEYQRIIQLIYEENHQNALELGERYSDMIEYYSTWAHQIKTPIASMRLRLQSEDSEYSRQLRQELNRIERYVEMVMTYLRLDSRESDLVIREQSLDEIVRGSIRKFSADFISRGLSMDYRPTELRIITDEKWLSFVLEQLLSNAIKYTERGRVSIYEEQGLLCIEDSGIGIAAEDLPRIFDKGYTGFNGRSDKRASGIGLYLCKRICDKLGHEISVESEVGEGTVVRLKLAGRRLEIE